MEVYMKEQNLLEQINELYIQKYWINNSEIKKIDELENQLWNQYYSLTGRKHLHHLFHDIYNLRDSIKDQRIAEIANDDQYDNLYFADPFQSCHKDYWDYAAQVIIKRGYPKIDNVIPELFVWLQDINWPGSYEIYKFLCSLPKEAILKYFENTVNMACIDHDEGWLYYLQQIMYHFKFVERDFKNKKLFEILNQKIDY